MTYRPWLNAKAGGTDQAAGGRARRCKTSRGRAAIQYRRPGCKNNRRQQGRRLSPSPVSLSGTGVEHRDRAAILRPARNVVADRDRPLLAIRDRAQALRLHATRNEILAHCWSASGTERAAVVA